MGIYFATASRDRTARLWSTDRSTALRIYAGHLSDVDVSSSSRRRLALIRLVDSVSDSIPTRFTSPRAPATIRADCGMYRKGRVFASSLVTKAQ